MQKEHEPRLPKLQTAHLWSEIHNSESQSVVAQGIGGPGQLLT